MRCVEIVDGGIEYDVEDEMCDADLKPNTKEECNKQECRPEWVAQPFGTVSSYIVIRYLHWPHIEVCCTPAPPN